MKFFSAIFFLTFLVSCADDSGEKYSRRRAKDAKVEEQFQKIESKFNYRMRPSESMQAGIDKKEVAKKVEKSEPSDLDNENAIYSSDQKYNNEEYENGQYSGYFKIGNPYEIFGVSYVPQDYDDYEETGTASWYGDDFHGKPTANGEIYNMEEMTAAHRTLPLPSLVRVTNLRNGRSVIVRVNDRGPFAKNRIIDVSEKAAIALGFKDKGTTEVKIELLRNETDELLEKLKIKKN